MNLCFWPAAFQTQLFATSPQGNKVTGPPGTHDVTAHHLVFTCPRYCKAEVLPVSQDLTGGLSVRTGNRVSTKEVPLASFHGSICVCVTAFVSFLHS